VRMLEQRNEFRNDDVGGRRVLSRNVSQVICCLLLNQPVLVLLHPGLKPRKCRGGQSLPPRGREPGVDPRIDPFPSVRRLAFTSNSSNQIGNRLLGTQFIQSRFAVRTAHSQGGNPIAYRLAVLDGLRRIPQGTDEDDRNEQKSKQSNPARRNPEPPP